MRHAKYVNHPIIISSFISDLLSPQKLLASADFQIVDRETRERVLCAQGVIALNERRGVIHLAPLVEAKGAHHIRDVVESGVVTAESAGLAVVLVVRVERREGQLAVRSLDDVLAVAHGDDLVLCRHGVAGDCLLARTGASHEVVPGVVADVVGAARGVDVQDIDAAAVGLDFKADVVAVDGHGEVGDAVDVDVTAWDADGGRVLDMRSEGDALSAGGGDEANSDGGNLGKHSDGDGLNSSSKGYLRAKASIRSRSRSSVQKQLLCGRLTYRECELVVFKGLLDFSQRNQRNEWDCMSLTKTEEKDLSEDD